MGLLNNFYFFFQEFLLKISEKKVGKNSKKTITRILETIYIGFLKLLEKLGGILGRNSKRTSEETQEASHMEVPEES